MTLIFTLTGAPQGKGRARAARTRFGVRLYTPEKTRSYEQAIRALARAEMGSLNPMSGPVAVTLRAVLEPPASWSEK
jgi:Holliday junction resolvase RusA-like endonuclease